MIHERPIKESVWLELTIPYKGMGTAITDVSWQWRGGRCTKNG
jgi:hypothetical protein